MTYFVVCHTRKGGVGKSTLAYELAYTLGAVLVDLEHDGGGVTKKWGYRPEDRQRIPLLDAISANRTPKPLTGFKKPRLIPNHPELYDRPPGQDEMADALTMWGENWDTDWVVVDTHPGASPHTHGALSIAHVVLAPSPLRTSDLDATEQLVNEMPDYPLVISPTMIPASPPARLIARLAKIVEGTPVQVGPPVPNASGVGTRSKRIAITAEDPPAKALRPFADAIAETATFLKEYVK